jgi:hypothetical protein
MARGRAALLAEVTWRCMVGVDHLEVRRWQGVCGGFAHRRRRDQILCPFLAASIVLSVIYVSIDIAMVDAKLDVEVIGLKGKWI